MADGLSTPGITQLEFTPKDHTIAQRIAAHLGYQQTAYTSTSALWGLFCLPENPADITGERCPRCQDRPGRDGLGRTCKFCGGDGWTRRPKYPRGTPTRGGVIIKTTELGFLFIQDTEDLGLGVMR